uniref:Uncharacterized protein n=1 Tax=Tanacetum cinerariifolium TaxID=118510 RepID=A0A6L2LE98_TANCI|nr:hypothetical protein [Tanacetum cinerariifolium]
MFTNTIFKPTNFHLSVFVTYVAVFDLLKHWTSTGLSSRGKIDQPCPTSSTVIAGCPATAACSLPVPNRNMPKKEKKKKALAQVMNVQITANEVRNFCRQNLHLITSGLSEAN